MNGSAVVAVAAARRKILLVDDEAAIVQSLRYNLERNGYSVLTAGDGRTAVMLASTESPDLVVLDIMLPLLDGIEACKEIRKVSTVPIIMLTAKDQEFDKVLALELGADDYVTKPFAQERSDIDWRDHDRPSAPATGRSRGGRGLGTQGVSPLASPHGESRPHRHTPDSAREGVGLRFRGRAPDDQRAYPLAARED